MQSHKPIIICGPTASGKTALALELAQELQKRNHQAVIINADSQQVYKEIPILSAQPSLEEKKLVPHYLFGEFKGDELFNVAVWLGKVHALLKQHPLAIIVGGTGMYLNALFKGLSIIPEIPDDIRERVRAMSKEELVENLGVQADGNTNRMRRNLEVKLATGKYIGEFHNDSKEPYQTSFNILNLNVSRETIYDNINQRFLSMLENGAIEEVKKLLEKNYPPNSSIMKAVGVPEIAAYLKGDVSRETMISTAQQKSRNYAKRQMTWFRNQLPEHKIDVASFAQVTSLVL